MSKDDDKMMKVTGDSIENENCTWPLSTSAYPQQYTYHNTIQPLFYSHYKGVSQHLQLRTGAFCWCKVLLPTCPCWWQPVHSDQAEDSVVLVNTVIYTVSILNSSTFINACNIFVGLDVEADRKKQIWKFMEDNKLLNRGPTCEIALVKLVKVEDMRRILPLLLIEAYYCAPSVRKGNWLLMWLTVTVTVSIVR